MGALRDSLRLLAASPSFLRLLGHLALFSARSVLGRRLPTFFRYRWQLQFVLLRVRRLWRLLDLPGRHSVQILHLNLLDLLLHFLCIERRLLILQLLLRMAELGRQKIAILPHFRVNRLDFIKLLFKVLSQNFQVILEGFFESPDRFLE